MSQPTYEELQTQLNEAREQLAKAKDKARRLSAYQDLLSADIERQQAELEARPVVRLPAKEDVTRGPRNKALEQRLADHDARIRALEARAVGQDDRVERMERRIRLQDAQLDVLHLGLTAALDRLAPDEPDAGDALDASEHDEGQKDRGRGPVGAKVSRSRTNAPQRLHTRPTSKIGPDPVKNSGTGGVQ